MVCLQSRTINMSAEVARKLSSDFSALRILAVRASKSSRARASSPPVSTYVCVIYPRVNRAILMTEGRLHQ